MEHDPACELAHGRGHSHDRGDAPGDAPGDGRSLVAVFDTPVAAYLLHFGRDLGYRTALVDPARAGRDLTAAGIDANTDVVVTDHDRAELGTVLRDVLALPTRWVGVMGSLRHTAPHVAALRDLGVPDADVARVHRPIGLNIGSRTPAEIAVATVAGLLADRNGRPGGFTWCTRRAVPVTLSSR